MRRGQPRWQGIDDQGSGPSDVAINPLPGGIGWIGKPDGFAGDGLYAWTSPSMTTIPYVRGQKLYPAPSDSTYYRYGGAAHAERRLTSGRMLASYSRNPKDPALLMRYGNAYMPQFVEVAPPVVAPPVVAPPPPTPTPTPTPTPSPQPLARTATPLPGPTPAVETVRPEPRGLVRLRR